MLVVDRSSVAGHDSENIGVMTIQVDGPTWPPYL